jgi:hypothetical protein
MTGIRSDRTQPGDGQVAKARVLEVVDAAQAAFWSRVATAFPQAKTGDLPPDVQHALRTVLVDAVIVWLQGNSLPAPTAEDDVIEAVRIEVRMGRATALVIRASRSPEYLCSWFTDEHSFTEADFLGRTPAEVRRHFHRLDVAFLQS